MSGCVVVCSASALTKEKDQCMYICMYVCMSCNKNQKKRVAFFIIQRKKNEKNRTKTKRKTKRRDKKKRNSSFQVKLFL